ncbi:MAG TPA: isoprenylcysteine carboxylmethyltransferase family protein [Draconibacterium sp.]|nr:isoprenylcysteine carboxylmethyltransferase family protein [Draconibacterium sp.]
MKTTIAANQPGGKLIFKVVSRFLFALVFIGVLLFVPAGTLKFSNGWLFIAGLMVPMIFTLVFLYIKNPELLVKRMNMNEKEDVQKKYIKFSFFIYITAYTIPGLDYRFQWSNVPNWLVIIAFIIMIGGYFMFVAVMIQNRYASRIIEIQNKQKLIDTGLYSVVRHPMYLAVIILFPASSLVLDSYFALIPMSLLPFLLALRIKNEEQVLLQGLPGYKAYMEKVKYRLIPLIW